MVKEVVCKVVAFKVAASKVVVSRVLVSKVVVARVVAASRLVFLREVVRCQACHLGMACLALFLLDPPTIRDSRWTQQHALSTS